jgi:hypothetical protein
MVDLKTKKQNSSYSVKERFLHGGSWIILFELPVAMGAIFLFYSLDYAIKDEFKHFRSVLAHDNHMQMLLLFLIVLLVLVTTPVRYFRLFAFISGNDTGYNLYRYIQIVFFISVPLLLVRAYQPDINYFESGIFSLVTTVSYILLPSLFLFFMMVDARKRMQFSFDDLLIKDSIGPVAKKRSVYPLLTYRMLSDSEAFSLGELQKEKLLEVKALGFRELGICEERTSSIVAVLHPLAVHSLLLKERSKIDFFLRVRTFYPILQSSFNDTIVTITANGIRFTSFLSDGWSLVTITGNSPEMTDAKKRFVVFSENNKKASEAWNSHQERIRDFSSKGRSTLKENLWEHYQDYGERSYNYGDLAKAFLSLWGVLIVSLLSFL